MTINSKDSHQNNGFERHWDIQKIRVKGEGIESKCSEVMLSPSFITRLSILQFCYFKNEEIENGTVK